MSEHFITNQGELLKDVMGRILPNTKSVDMLVGYFYFSGFQQLWRQIGEKRVRILVGLDVDKTVYNGINECYLITNKTTY